MKGQFPLCSPRTFTSSVQAEGLVCVYFVYLQFSFVKFVTCCKIFQPPSSSSHLRQDSAAVNTFTIRHKLLEISTNSVSFIVLFKLVSTPHDVA